MQWLERYLQIGVVFFVYQEQELVKSDVLE